MKLKKAIQLELPFLVVPGTGFEPARPFEHHHLKVACLPISTPGQRGCKCKVPARCHQIFFEGGIIGNEK